MRKAYCQPFKLWSLTLTFTLIFSMGILPNETQAQTVYVGTWDALNFANTCTWGQQDDNYLGSINNPYASWETAYQAIDNLGNQTIQFLPDVYIGSFDYDEDGFNETCGSGQIASTYSIDAADNGIMILGTTGGCGTLIDLSEGGSATTNFVVVDGVDGMTVKDIYFKSWGQVLDLDNSTNITIEDCVFDNSDLGSNAVDILNCTNVSFINCTFIGSKGTSGFKQMKIEGSSTVTLTDCVFTCNADPGERGGALYINNAGGTVNINGGSFSKNTAEGTSGTGGGIRIDGGTVNITGTSFCGNVAESTSGEGGGGAIAIANGATVTISGANFYNNMASNNGGAINFNVDNGGGPALTINSNTIFDDNQATADGGAIFASLETTVIIDDSYFSSNDAAAGGGIFMDADDASASFNLKQNILTISNSTFEANTSSTSQRAGGVHVHMTETSDDVPAHGPADVITITNTKMCGNTSPTIAAKDLSERTQADGTFGPDVVSSVNISSNDNDIDMGRAYNGDSSTFDQGDCTSPTSGWTGTPTTAACSTVDCVAGVCALSIPAVCFATQYGETSSHVCTDAAATAEIHGQVWIDTDGDGVQSGSEVGHADVEKVVVLLFDENGYLLGRTLTDANGDYSFVGIPAGNYTVQFQSPDAAVYPNLTTQNAPGSTESTDSDASGAVPTDPLAGGPTQLVGGEASVSLSAGEVVNDVDAGYTPSVSIRGYVWDDNNSDGIQDMGEPPVSGITVELLDDMGMVIATTTTDSNGAYSFDDMDGLVNGNTYSVRFPTSTTISSETHNITTQNAGDDSIDSDPNTGNGESSSIVVTINSINQSIDAGYAAAPLPVELTSFFATQKDCKVILKWYTTSESNNKGFEILRSTNGKDFKSIGWVNGHGNSSRPQNYTYTDTEAPKTAYYRLKQVDFDGRFTLSEVAFVQLHCGNNILLEKVFPNPAASTLWISISSFESPDQEATLEVFNTTGMNVFTRNISLSEGENTLNINVNDWRNGLYFIRVISPSGNFSELTRFVKEN